MELIFILAFLSLAVSLLAALISVLRGRRRKALWLATACAASSVLYIAVVITAAVLSPQRVLAVGEDRWFDDWCVAVSGVTVASEVGEAKELVKAEGKFYVVTLRLSNRARGREQAQAASPYIYWTSAAISMMFRLEDRERSNPGTACPHP